MTENIAAVRENTLEVNALEASATTTTSSAPHADRPQRAPNPRLKAATNTLTNVVVGASGFVLLAVLWQVLAQFRELPGVFAIASELWQQLRSPFRSDDVNDLGIGLLTSYSLFRVCSGFLLGSLVAIPAGFAVGSIPFVKRAFAPVIETLRPISPIAWIPIGLALLGSAPMAAIFVIFITSLWPTLINTAFGVASLPDDYKNVARVFQFNKIKYIKRIVLPFALPHIITGLRLSMGVAWLVIVAVESLNNLPGIGGFMWDSWNALNLARSIGAILVIGMVGLILDRGFDRLHKKFAY